MVIGVDVCAMRTEGVAYMQEEFGVEGIRYVQLVYLTITVSVVGAGERADETIQHFSSF